MWSAESRTRTSVSTDWRVVLSVERSIARPSIIQEANNTERRQRVMTNFNPPLEGNDKDCWADHVATMARTANTAAD
jgi:hypothetical protein